MSDWGSNAGGGGGWGATPTRAYSNDARNADSFGAASDSFGAANGYSFDKPTGDSGCHNCGEEGHFSRECPQPKKNKGACFNCDQEGHNKADCINPRLERPFTGTCHICEQEGHRAAECPDKPAVQCRNCGEVGHISSNCEAARDIGVSTAPTVSSAKAIQMMKDAADEHDLDEFRVAMLAYVKSKSSEPTWIDVEKLLRARDIGVYLIALERELSKAFTAVDLQGKQDKKFVVSLQYTNKARRRQEKESWPATPEQNLERLADAGEQMTTLKSICPRCGEMGHTVKHCPEERVEVQQPSIICINCNEEGHRMRSCPQPIKDRNAINCRNCGEDGHKAADCEQPSTSGGGDRSCRNCGQEGHMARDCDLPRKMTCRNCDEDGHMSRKCPKPTDWSRVTCSHCKEKGHTIRRCPTAPAEGEGGGPGENGFGGFGGSGSTHGFGNSAGFGDSAGLGGSAGYGDSNGFGGDGDSGFGPSDTAGGGGISISPSNDAGDDEW